MNVKPAEAMKINGAVTAGNAITLIQEITAVIGITAKRVTGRIVSIAILKKMTVIPIVPLTGVKNAMAREIVRYVMEIQINSAVVVIVEIVMQIKLAVMGK